MSHLPADPRVFLLGDCPVSVNSSQEAPHSSQAAPDDSRGASNPFGALKDFRQTLDESPEALDDLTEDIEAPLEDHDGWKAALNAVGDSMMSWLKGELPDMNVALAAGFPAEANVIKNWLKGGNPPAAYDDLAFGLPRSFFSKSVTEHYLRTDCDITDSFDEVSKQSKRSGNKELKNKLNAARGKATTIFSPLPSGVERRAAPLAVSLVGCNGADAGKRLKIIFTSLAGDFLPPETKIAAQRKTDNITAVLPAPNDEAVAEFIDKFLANLGAEPVFGGND